MRVADGERAEHDAADDDRHGEGGAWCQSAMQGRDRVARSRGAIGMDRGSQRRAPCANNARDGAAAIAAADAIQTHQCTNGARAIGGHVAGRRTHDGRGQRHEDETEVRQAWKAAAREALERGMRRSDRGRSQQGKCTPHGGSQ